jgi:preprotein translocase subunit SecE
MKGKQTGLQSAESEQPKFDRFKWLLIFLLIIAGIVANYYYAQVAWGIRAAVGIVLLIIVLALALWTQKGQQAWSFIKAARGELRKVTWPTRQETLQTTLVVVAMVVVTALVLWGLDTLFFWMVSLVTGQRG